MAKRGQALVATKHREPQPARVDPEAAAAEHFIEGVIARGDASRTTHGNLAPGATHEIVEGDCQEGPVKIQRRRYSSV